MKLTRATIATLAAFSVSVGLNIFLFRQTVHWKEAFFKQAATTAEVEVLFKESEADTSYENVLTLSRRVFGDDVKEVQAGQWFVGLGADEQAIQLFSGKLLFKDGKYYGSEAHVPGH